MKMLWQFLGKSRIQKGCEKMNGKMTILGISLGLLLLVVGMNGGCAGVTTTTYFYYYPDWTPDGKILCSRNVQYTSQGTGGIGGGGGSVSNNYYLTIMDADGSNERDIKNIDNSAKVAASPLGNYYAYAESYANYIHIVDTNGNSVNSIDCGANVDSFDWSPDETRLVYGIKTSVFTGEVHVVNRDGTNNNILTTGEGLAWREGDYIAFEFTTPEGATLSVIKPDATSLNRIGIGFNPQFIENNTILYGYGLQIRQINIDGTQGQQLFDNFDGSNPKISYDKSKLVAMDANKGYGIIVINISGTGEVYLK